MTEQVFHLGIKAIIHNARGEVLLLKRVDREGWDLPGGRIQQGESVLETLKREVFEETGLIELANITPQQMVLAQGTVLSQFKINTSHENITASGLILWLHKCTTKEEQEVILGPEHQDFLWVTSEQACALLPSDYGKGMSG